MLVAQTYNLSYLGGWDWEDGGSIPACTKKFSRPHLRGKKKKKSQAWCGARLSF
jgi:hypothetical protein